MTAVDRLLGQLEGVKRSGAGWMAKCPAHKDNTASLKVDRGDGCALVHCHAGCTGESVVEALGLTKADLYDEARKSTGREPEAVYDYVDEAGGLLFQVCRFPGKRFGQRRPDGRGGYVWKLGDTRRVLYRLPQVLAALDDRMIVVAEGEKDVHALEEFGFVATSAPMGAGKWRAEYAESLRGARHVVVIPDDDTEGRKHAAEVARSLVDAAELVRVVELWPRGESKADISDWLAQANGSEEREQAAEMLREIIRKTPVFDPEKLSDLYREGVGQKRFLTAREFASLAPSEVLWVARPWVAQGALTEVEGKIKAAGKTTWVLALCAAVVDGEPFMGEPTVKSPVVYLTEQPGASFREALRRAALLECDDFHVLFRLDNLDLSWAEIVDFAAAKCVEVGARLLVVDTLGPFAGLEGDAENSAGDAQAAVAPLQAAAYQHSLALKIVRHSRKGGGEIGESGRGSSAFGGAVDLLISLRRREGNFPKSQRIIYTLGRFDETPDDLVIDLTDEGYVALGSEDEAGRERIREALRAVLDGRALTESELVEAFESEFGEGRVSRSNLRRVLEQEREQGTLHRVGEGKKGDPFRYQLDAPESLSDQPPPYRSETKNEGAA